MQKQRNCCSALDSENENPAIHWMDCTKISGTDCYCDDDAQVEIKKMLDQALIHCKKANAEMPGVHFFDNGNYHYMSKLWTDRIQEPFDLVIFDHHPDMQPPRFEGILSCGGWVKEVLDHNPYARNVLLMGVADHLIEEIQNEPSTEFKKYANRVTFVPESSLQNSNGIPALTQDFLGKSNLPIYISIDKDALSPNDAVTNWDQGSLTFLQLEQILHALFAQHKIIGIDICGERANNQDYTDGIDEGIADGRNDLLNTNLFKTIQKL